MERWCSRGSGSLAAITAGEHASLPTIGIALMVMARLTMAYPTQCSIVRVQRDDALPGPGARTVRRCVHVVCLV